MNDNITSKTPIKKAGKLTVREYLWSKIRQHQVFSTAQLIDKAPKHYKLDNDKASYYLKGWEKAGYLSSVITQTNNVLIRFKTYTLMKDTGTEPPRVDPKGQKITTGLGREQLWRTMRMIGQFNYKQLATIAATDEVIIAESEAKTYVSMLFKAGYLHCVQAAHNGGGLAVYILKSAAWTGNKPPMVKRQHIVFDQNNHEIVYPKLEEIEGDY